MPGKPAKPSAKEVTSGSDSINDQLVPGFSTVLAWARESRLAAILGVLAAATVILFAVRTTSAEDSLIWSLVAIAALVAFAWAILVLHRYPSAPLPAKMLAWCLCTSGGMVFLSGATKLMALTFGWDLPSWQARQLAGCTGNKSWHSQETYDGEIYPTNTKKKLYPAKVFARERQTGQYEICAVWVPVAGEFHSRSWLTPREFASMHLELARTARLISFDSLTLRNGGVRIQATWVDESAVAWRPGPAIATLREPEAPL